MKRYFFYDDKTLTDLRFSLAMYLFVILAFVLGPTLLILYPSVRDGDFFACAFTFFGIVALVWLCCGIWMVYVLIREYIATRQLVLPPEQHRKALTN